MADEQPKLSWMYKGLQGHVDKEEYLTGRKIDKTFELIRAEETGTSKGDLELDGVDVVPKSVLAGPSSGAGLTTVDIMAKLREDPLYEIKKREIDKRKEILNNPLKMKRIANMLKQTLSSASDSDSSSEDDRRRHHKKSKKKRKKRADDSDDDRARSSSRLDTHRYRDHHRDHRRDDRRHDRSRSSKRSRSRSNERHSARKRSKSRERAPARHDNRRGKPSTESHRHSDKADITPRQETRRAPSKKFEKPKSAVRPKLSAEELEQRRLQMMSDAQRREVERKQHVEKLKLDEKRDAERETSTGAGFIKEQLSRAFNEDTLEKSIKQKAFKSQTGRSMDANSFSRR